MGATTLRNGAMRSVLFVLVLVGAINVGSIETVWAGRVTPPYGRQVQRKDFTSGARIELDRGAEMGRFNLGSTVILLSEQRLAFALPEDAPIRMGQTLAQPM